MHMRCCQAGDDARRAGCRVAGMRAPRLCAVWLLLSHATRLALELWRGGSARAAASPKQQTQQQDRAGGGRLR